MTKTVKENRTFIHIDKLADAHAVITSPIRKMEIFLFLSSSLVSFQFLCGWFSLLVSSVSDAGLEALVSGSLE